MRCAVIALLILSSAATAVPSKVFLNIPFVPQAPFGVWDETYSEACEEISIIMALRYVKNRGLTRSEADKEILRLVAYQNEHYGGHYDLDVAQTARLMEDFYGFKDYEVVRNATADTMIEALAKGYPVIAPMAGRLLNNPYYKRPGPVYHMLVVKGYDLRKREFITNDGGTRRGLNYRYGFDLFMNALHDWPGKKEDIKKGGKSIIIIKK